MDGWMNITHDEITCAAMLSAVGVATATREWNGKESRTEVLVAW